MYDIYLHTKSICAQVRSGHHKRSEWHALNFNGILQRKIFHVCLSWFVCYKKSILVSYILQIRTEQFGFSVKDWCQYILRQGSWCDAIFIKLVASMWGCRISVLRADNLREVTYRYEGSYDKADIILMFNGNPTKGHYSAVGHSGKNLEFESNEVDPITFSPSFFPY